MTKCKSPNTIALMQNLKVYNIHTGEQVGKGWVFYYHDRMSVPTLYDDNGLLPEGTWYTLEIVDEAKLVLINETIQ